MSTPLLSCDRPRFAGAELALDAFDAEGPLLVLVGAWHPLFQLIAGQQSLRGGSLRVAGIEAEGAAASGAIGLVLADEPLPLALTLHEALVHSACLLGEARRSAAERARSTVRELGLVELESKRLLRASPGERRAAAIASAVLGEPRALALEEPFGGLEPSQQSYVARVLERALSGRQALVSLPELPASPEQEAIVANAAELLFLSASGFVARGSYAELVATTRTYRVMVSRAADALVARLGEAGYEVRHVVPGEVTALWLADAGGRGTLPVFRAALELDAPIIELLPLGLGAEDRAAPEGRHGR